MFGRANDDNDDLMDDDVVSTRYLVGPTPTGKNHRDNASSGLNAPDLLGTSYSSKASLRGTRRMSSRKRRERQPHRTKVAALCRQRRLATVSSAAAAAAAGLLLGIAPYVAEAQYKADTPLYEENMETGEVELTALLKGGGYVEDAFYPDRQVLTDDDDDTKW